MNEFENKSNKAIIETHWLVLVEREDEGVQCSDGKFFHDSFAKSHNTRGRGFAQTRPGTERNKAKIWYSHKTKIRVS